MLRKKDETYFDKFVELVGFSCRAAEHLDRIMKNYNADELQERMEEIHDIEHQADIEKHIMIKKLSKEFITPIEREDVMDMAHAIDNVTDAIEDIMIRMYMFNIRAVRKEAIKMADVITSCCKALSEALEEFHNFRKSQTLHGLIVEVNRLEEEGDRLYMEGMRNLYTTCKDPIEIIGWTKVFDSMEQCCDVCENVSDVIESVIMKNS